MEDIKKQSFLQKPFLVAIAAALVIISAGIYYHWTQIQALNKQAAQLNDSKQSLQKQLTESQEKNSGLITTNNDLQKQIDQLKNPTQVIPIATFQDAAHWGSGLFLDGNDFLVVRVTIKDNSTHEGYFSLSDFKLKDSQNNVYSLYSQSAVGSQPRFSTGVEGLPNGKVELKSQTLRAGESIQGVALFYVPSGIKNFSLLYNAQTFPISL